MSSSPGSDRGTQISVATGEIEAQTAPFRIEDLPPGVLLFDSDDDAADGAESEDPVEAPPDPAPRRSSAVKVGVESIANDSSRALIAHNFILHSRALVRG